MTVILGIREFRQVREEIFRIENYYFQKAKFSKKKNKTKKTYLIKTSCLSEERETKKLQYLSKVCGIFCGFISKNKLGVLFDGDIFVRNVSKKFILPFS